MRVNIKGDIRAVKIWLRGDPEPDKWTFIGVGPGLTTGYVGLALVSGVTTKYCVCDFFSVCTTGRPAWGPL